MAINDRRLVVETTCSRIADASMHDRAIELINALDDTSVAVFASFSSVSPAFCDGLVEVLMHRPEVPEASTPPTPPPDETARIETARIEMALNKPAQEVSRLSPAHPDETGDETGHQMDRHEPACDDGPPPNTVGGWVPVKCGHVQGFFDRQTCQVWLNNGLVVSPTIFERMGGKGRSKKWKQSIRVMETGRKIQELL